MNIQQFQYVLALAEHRHFETAAEKCFVSQSTLSTMILKLEEELGIVVFDRRRKPVDLTAEGQKVVDQLRRIMKEIGAMKEMAAEMKGEVSGQLKIAAIPTIAPFLLPLFLPAFAAQFPKLQIEVREQTTDEIVRALKLRELDMGIVSLPIHDPLLLEYPLYDEPFVYFDAGHKHPKQVDLKRINLDNMCLLEEGHCMRNQVIELCDMHNKVLRNKLNFNYKAGSIDGVLRFVRANKGATLLPWLSAMELPPAEQERVSRFVAPAPFRSVGLLVHAHFVRHTVRVLMQDEILRSVKNKIPKSRAAGHMLSPLT